MSEPPRRPILKLKFNPPPRLPEPPAPAPAPLSFFAPKKPMRMARPKPPAPPKIVLPWKCRPCGTGFNVPEDLPDDESVRCPSCNARLGKAGDFRSDPPLLEKLRARPAGKA